MCLHACNEAAAVLPLQTQFFLNVYDEHVSLFEAVSSHQYIWL